MKAGPKRDIALAEYHSVRSFLKTMPNTFVFGMICLVAGAGFEPHDLRVMSPTSYQAAPPRDILVPETGIEPVRDISPTGF